MKGSVASKKAARLRKKKHFPVYVSRIRLDNDQMEVTTLEEELVTAGEKQPTVSVSSLKIGQELSGIIQRVEDYGIFVNVGANRPGLLHIRRVGDLYQKFIHKSAGLKKVGLTKGVQVNVQVISCDQKRLFLDFSDSLKQEAELKYSKVAAQQEEDTNAQVDPYAEEAALFVAQQQQNAESTTSLVDDYDEEDYDEDDDEEDDDYDEDRDIEDAMGLGRY